MVDNNYFGRLLMIFFISKCCFWLVDDLSFLGFLFPIPKRHCWQYLYPSGYVTMLPCWLYELKLWVFVSFLDKSMVDNNHSLIWEDYLEVLFLHSANFWIIYATSSWKSKFKPLWFDPSGYYANLDQVACMVKWETLYLC